MFKTRKSETFLVTNRTSLMGSEWDSSSQVFREVPRGPRGHAHAEAVTAAVAPAAGASRGRRAVPRGLGCRAGHRVRPERHWWNDAACEGRRRLRSTCAGSARDPRADTVPVSHVVVRGLRNARRKHCKPQTVYNVAFWCLKSRDRRDVAWHGAGRSAGPQRGPRSSPPGNEGRGEGSARAAPSSTDAPSSHAEAAHVRFADGTRSGSESVFRVAALTSSARSGPCACAPRYRTRLRHSRAVITTPDTQMRDVMGSPPRQQT